MPKPTIMFGLAQKKLEEDKPSEDSSGIAKIKALKGLMSIDAFRTLVLQIRKYKANKDKEVHEPKFIAILDSDLYLKDNQKYDEARSLLYSVFHW